MVGNARHPQPRRGTCKGQSGTKYQAAKVHSSIRHVCQQLSSVVPLSNITAHIATEVSKVWNNLVSTSLRIFWNPAGY